MSTQKTYKTGIIKFDEFCKKHKIINPLPVDQRLLCYYITYLAQRGLADSTIRVYLSALKHHHIAYDIPEPDRTKMPKLKLVDSGVRRTKARTPKTNPPPCYPWHPETDLQTLVLIMTWLWNHHAMVRKHLVLLRFLQAGRTPQSYTNTKYDASSHLSFEDVAVDSHSSPDLPTLVARKSGDFLINRKKPWRLILETWRSDFRNINSISKKIKKKNQSTSITNGMRCIHWEMCQILCSWSGKIVLNKGPKWSAVARGKLCCTRKFITITSALITSSLVDDSWKNFETDGWLFVDLSSFLCVAVIQWSFTSFRAWWPQLMVLL